MTQEAIRKLFENGKPAGVYWLKGHAAVAELSKLAKSCGMAFFHLEGQKIEKKEQFMGIWCASIFLRCRTTNSRRWFTKSRRKGKSKPLKKLPTSILVMKCRAWRGIAQISFSKSTASPLSSV